MLAYHGSHVSGLKQLEYTEENSRFGGKDKLLHGAGIYLTLSRTEAEGYGEHLYIVNVVGSVFDTTNESVLELFINTFFSDHGINLKHIKNKEIQSLIRLTTIGEASGVFFHKDLFLVLTNEYSLYHDILETAFKGDSDLLLKELELSFPYNLIQIRNKSNGNDWLICLSPEGKGLDIIEETISSK